MTLLMLVGASAIVPFARDVGKPTTVVPPALLALIKERFRDHVSVRAAAEVYLSRYPAEFDPIRLCRLLLNGINLRADDSLLGQLKRRAVREFAAGEIVLIDGWVLARSEARLFAAASLVTADV
jgi:hypothetical protein